MRIRRVKHIVLWLVVIAIVLLLFSSHVIAENDFYRQRHALMNIIKAEITGTHGFLDRDSLDEPVLNALLKIPRHEFVPDSGQPYAYDNRPLPIVYSQTIPQPYIVAVMHDRPA
ncbi:MAG: protein-L-isoaspartate O-methyltransferase family protein [Methylobacter sp.]